MSNTAHVATVENITESRDGVEVAFSYEGKPAGKMTFGWRQEWMQVDAKVLVTIGRAE